MLFHLLRGCGKSCGANVLKMSVSHHDEVLAATSHLPHLIAFSLVDTLAGEEDNKDIFPLCCWWIFVIFTRIAASDPIMWHDIFLANSHATLEVLERFVDDLNKLRDAIQSQDSETLLGVFYPSKSGT